MLESVANPRFKYVRDLMEQKKARTDSGVFVVEGQEAIESALRHGWPLQQLVYSPERMEAAWVGAVVARTEQHLRLTVSGELLDRLSRRTNASEALAILAQPQDDFSRVPRPADLLVVVLECPGNPGNLGEVVRSAHAFAAQGVIVVEPAVDLYHPRTLQATVGSLFAVPVVRAENLSALLTWIAALRVDLPALQVLGTSSHAPMRLDGTDLNRPTVLVFGNEQRGLSPELTAACDAETVIPLAGTAESLNLSASAAIALYEARRQRYAARTP